MSEKKYSIEDIKPVKPRPELFENIDISKDGFRKNLIISSERVVKFTRNYVLNVLPDEIRFVVYLGVSNDANPLDDGEQVYPNDYSERKRFFSDVDDVVELLFREGKVPEWINVTVDSEDGESTKVKLECCGRFSDRKEHMYPSPSGISPFHILGPALPPWFDKNSKKKFDLYWDEERKGETD